MDLEELLNDSQRAAVEYNNGASVIVAGAGSGKTRVLTYKIAYLLEQGLPAYNILALTFTNKAAREMKDRVMRVVGPKACRALWMGTFHSVFSKILRCEAESIGFTPQFTIYDTTDSKNVVKTIVKEMGLNDKDYKPGNIQGLISNAKNHLITPQLYKSDYYNSERDNRRNIPMFAEIYERYCRRCRESNAMDFDDLLVYTAFLFKQRPDILERYQERFKYILVDEYQDTNTVQHNIVMSLAARNKRVCVVGDDAQSIYSFRGAEIENILGFQSCFDECRLFKLEQNYRSTQTIVNAANSLIAKNRNRIRKNVFSRLSVGDPIKVISNYSDYEEGDFVARSIKNVVDRRYAAYEDIAILYRTNSQSRVIEEALRSKSIPYKIYGGLSFYQRKEIKDIIAYLRLTINPSDEEALKRVINFPARGIGDTTQQKLFAAIHENPQIPALDIVAAPASFNLPVNKGTAAKLENFAEIIRKFVDMAADSDAYGLTEQVILESGIMADVTSDTSVENLSRKDNINEFLNAVHEFCDKRVNEGNNDVSINDFLSEVSLLTDQDNSNEIPDAVTLMTVHASKGLEFAHVYIVGMEENLFPSMMVETERELEEERRLFYVAITRAKERCTITYAKSRFRNGQTQFSNPSRFLYDIDRKYLKLPEESTFGCGRQVNPYASDDNSYFSNSRPNRATVIKSPPPSAAKRLVPLASVASSGGSGNCTIALKPGDNVRHATFGIGSVLSVEGSGDNTKAKVAFKEYGEKQLLLKFARIEKL